MNRKNPARKEFLRALAVLAIVLALGILTSCQGVPDERIVTKVGEREMEVPASLLKCLPEPVAKEAWTTQREVALFMIKLAEAGRDCRVKLDSVRKLLLKN